MNSLDNIHHSNLSQFADHSTLQIAKVSKNGRFKQDVEGRPIIDLKILDLNNISLEKLDKYFKEGTLVYVLDGHEAQFSSDFALKHLGSFKQCSLNLIPLKAQKNYSELHLKHVAISCLENNDYQAVKELCQELLNRHEPQSGSLSERTVAASDENLQAKEKIKGLIAKTWFQEEEKPLPMFPENADATPLIAQHVDLKGLLALRATSKDGRETANARLVQLFNEGAITPTSLGIHTLEDLLSYFGRHVQSITCLNTGPYFSPGSSVMQREGFNPGMSDKQVKLLVDSCPRLTELVLFQFDLTNKSGVELSKLTRLTHLSFNSGQNFTDFSFIAKLKELQFLSLNGSEVEDLSFLKELPKLKKLYLEECNSIKDANQIAFASQLEDLSIRMCWGIKDFTFLKTLTHLKTLDVMECKITHLTILEGCKDLKTLTLWGCDRVRDWEFLEQHPEIEAIGARTSN